MNTYNTCNDQKIRCLVIDCSGLAYCDHSGAETLVELIEELDDHKIRVFLADCPLDLIQMFERMNKSEILESNVYPTVANAVNSYFVTQPLRI